MFDVSGAGDTVVAVMAACLAAKLSILDAMRVANHAAGIVVSKLGTATATRDEIAASLLFGAGAAVDDDGALLDWDAAAALRWSLGERETNGRVRQRLLRSAARRACLADPAGSGGLRPADRRYQLGLSVERLKGPARPFRTKTCGRR